MAIFSSQFCILVKYASSYNQCAQLIIFNNDHFFGFLFKRQSLCDVRWCWVDSQGHFRPLTTDSSSFLAFQSSQLPAHRYHLHHPLNLLNSYAWQLAVSPTSFFLPDFLSSPLSFLFFVAFMLLFTVWPIQLHDPTHILSGLQLLLE